MNFLTPIALWFGLALPAVVVFYLLKRKRVTRVVPSTLLWQRFLAENQASAPLQRLRHNWLLLLQLLLLLLLVLALGRPYFAGKAGVGKLQVVVLDASASMQATDESPSRFEKARKEALALVDSLASSRGGQMIVLVAGGNAEVRQSATSEKAALRRALEGAAVTDSPTRLAEALRVAETLIRDTPDGEIHLFSDGAIPELAEFETRDLRLVYHRVGQRAQNAGIVAFDVKSNPENPEQRALFISVVNHDSNPVETRLELSFEGQLVETKAVTLPATNTTPVVFLAAQARDGVFTARLTTPDDLMADNQASVVSLLPQPVRILLVTRGNRFLEKALSAAGANVELALATDHGLNEDGRYDLVVLDDVVPSEWPTGNLLAVHVARTNWFEGDVGQLEGPPIVNWRNTHPLLRFVSFDNVQVASALSVRAPDWGMSLVDAPQSPLVVAGEMGRQRLVWLAFDTLESTWPLRISFPIFIANAVDWLNPATARAEQFQVKAGDAFRFPLSVPVTEGVVTGPDGQSTSVPVSPQASEFTWNDTVRQGVYRVRLGTNQVTFAANLLDAAESNIRPRDTLELGRFTQVTATTEKDANLEYWRWFALAGLAVMLGEWWWFHRRTA
jgi:Ca-activated chloride channel family protein